MKNEQFYKIVIVLLLLLNGCTLAYLWTNKDKTAMQMEGPGPMRGPGNPVDRMMTERLQLTKEQEEAFRHLKDEHHAQMLEIQQEERTLHTQLFALLKVKDVDAAAKNALLTQLEANDRKKEEVTFEHFRKLRGILTPEQEPNFDELVEDIAGQIMSHHRDGNRLPPPPRD